MNKTDHLIVAAIAFIGIWFAVSFSVRFSLESAVTDPDPESCIPFISKRGLTESICSHPELLNSAWGDSLHYFSIAAGEGSNPPYSLRPLIPKFIGTTTQFAMDALNIPYSKDNFFKATSLCFQVFNGACILALLLIPLIHFRKGLLNSPITMLLISLNAVNIGVLQTAPFFMLDVPSYVVFTLAASAFFMRRLVLLGLIAAFGISIKEITIILIIPLIYLWWTSGEKRIQSLWVVALPVAVFISIRYLNEIDLLSVQYGWNISKGEIKLHVLAAHLASFKHALYFSMKVLAAVGAPLIISVFLYRKFKTGRGNFFTCLAMLLAVVLANLLLGSRVPRVVESVSSFFIFYALFVITGTERSSDLPRFSGPSASASL